MQRVEGVTPGQTYQFSIAAYIWSSMGGNFYLSEQPGDAVVRVGIDPTGGTNPWARSVVWSPFQSFYDQWRVLTVDAVAQSSALTVFFWSHQQYPVIHNDVAVDEAYLGLADGAPVAPAAAPAVEVAPPVVESPAPVSPVSPTGVTMTASIDLRLRAGLYGQVLDVIPAVADSRLGYLNPWHHYYPQELVAGGRVDPIGLLIMAGCSPGIPSVLPTITIPIG